MKGTLTYRIDGRDRVVQFSGSVDLEDLVLDVKEEAGHVHVLLTPRHTIELINASYVEELNLEDSRVYLNGYQSWTDSREWTKEDTMQGLLHLPKKLVEKFALDGYGDYNFTEYRKQPGFFHGFTYGYVRRNGEYELIGSLNEKNGFTVLYMDMTCNTLRVEKDCEGKYCAASYDLFDVKHYVGSKKEVFDAWFKDMGIKPCTAGKITGYTSWYNYYQKIDQNKIMENLRSIAQADFKYDVFQIDDGYEQFVGDWLKIDPKKFPDGLEPIARSIQDSGMTAGIWLAPFACELKSDLYKEHPDWIVRKEDGKPLLCGNNWSFFAPLDIYNEEVRAYVRSVFEFYKGMGFHFFKLDFLYGACMRPIHGHTRGEVEEEAMKLLRECVGEDPILACGVPLAPCFGRVEYMRIGCDVSLDWDNTWWWRLLHRERTGTKPSLYNTVYRHHLDGRAFRNDPDVFLLRGDLKLNEEQKKSLLTLNTLCGSLLFTSDNVGTYDEKTSSLFKEGMKNQNAELLEIVEEGEILDLLYELNGKKEHFCLNMQNGHILKDTREN